MTNGRRGRQGQRVEGEDEPWERRGGTQRAIAERRTGPNSAEESETGRFKLMAGPTGLSRNELLIKYATRT
jgi:hypothetical protein